MQSRKPASEHKKEDAKHKKEFLRYTGANLKTLPKNFASWIDPQIRNAVVELNRSGFKTMLSCAGHSTYGVKPQIIKYYARDVESGITKESWYSQGYGYILLYSKGYVKEHVLMILKKHGLTGIKTHNCKYQGIYGIFVTFDPVGHINRDKNEIGSGMMVEYRKE